MTTNELPQVVFTVIDPLIQTSHYKNTLKVLLVQTLDPTNVHIAQEDSLDLTKKLNMNVYTQEKNHMNVKFVERLLECLIV